MRGGKEGFSLAACLESKILKIGTDFRNLEKNVFSELQKVRTWISYPFGLLTDLCVLN